MGLNENELIEKIRTIMYFAKKFACNAYFLL